MQGAQWLVLLLATSAMLALPATQADYCYCQYDRDLTGGSPIASRFSQTRPINIVEFPLHYAVIMWDVKGIEAMLKDKQSRGAAMVNTPDDQGHTPLQYLLITGDSLSWHPYTDTMYKIASLLLAAGAKPDIAFSADNFPSVPKGYTPLEWVSLDGRYEFAKLLLKYGADVKRMDSEKVTALHVAAGCDSRRSTDDGAAATVVALLNAGADPLAKDKDGRTPFAYISYNCGKDATCPQTCKVMQAAVAAAKANKSTRPGDVKIDFKIAFNPKDPKCCSDSKTADNSQCCI